MKSIKIFPALITFKGLTELGNLAEEYHLNHELSYKKLASLEMLLLTYYMQTGDIIHKDIFDQIDKKFTKFSDCGSSYSKKIPEFLSRSGCVVKNPDYISLENIK